MTIAWTKLALRDLHRVRNYIAADRPRAADDIVERLGRAVESLLSYANLGRRGRVRGTRELVIVGTPYLVPYRVKKKRIEVLAVLHGARRWPDEF